MYNQQDEVSRFMFRAGQKVEHELSEPTEQDIVLSAQLILDEALKTIEGLGVSVTNIEPMKCIGRENLVFEITKEMDMVKTADGVINTIYISIGIANRCGFRVSGLWDEVHKSNMSKFIDGYKNADGKWINGGSYKPAKIAYTLIDGIESGTYVDESCDVMDVMDTMYEQNNVLIADLEGKNFIKKVCKK